MRALFLWFNSFLKISHPNIVSHWDTKYNWESLHNFWKDGCNILLPFSSVPGMCLCLHTQGRCSQPAFIQEGCNINHPQELCVITTVSHVVKNRDYFYKFKCCLFYPLTSYQWPNPFESHTLRTGKSSIQWVPKLHHRAEYQTTSPSPPW